MSNVLCYVAALTAAGVSIGALVRNRRSATAACFAIGMAVFALQALFDGISIDARTVNELGKWQLVATIVRAAGPIWWLAFSLMYCRSIGWQVFRTWWPVLLVAVLLPLLSIVMQRQLLDVKVAEDVPVRVWIHFNAAGKLLNASLLVFPILVLMNIERTFRTAIGTTRWRIKFVLIGIVVIFGARFYTRSQAMIFSGQDLSLLSFEATALIIGCACIVIGYVRGGFTETALYPSRAVLQMSLTLLLASAYLLIVGILAPIVARAGAASLFPIAALFVLAAIVFLMLILLSDRIRQQVRLFISRHFRRPEYDFRIIWRRFSRGVAPILEESQLGSAACRLVADTLAILSVSLWRFDPAQKRLVCVASTAGISSDDPQSKEVSAIDFPDRLRKRTSEPVDLENLQATWAAELRREAIGYFRTGGNRLCLPLVGTREDIIGLMLLADRVAAAPFTAEELDLLTCLGEQIAASIMNVRLARELVIAKENQAFETMSAFFVHDLKNTASSLGLMLQNLPSHFDDPAFREDIFRGIGNAAAKIKQLISRLASFRGELQLVLQSVDLNELITNTVQQLNGGISAKISTELLATQPVTVDPEKIQSVLTNLLLNAADAINSSGQIIVKTVGDDRLVLVSVTDNGIGMSQEFIEKSLFRPFQTTKEKGLGIGMFQTRMIVEAHRGTIEVDSVVGKGTVFRVTLPARIKV